MGKFTLGNRVRRNTPLQPIVSFTKFVSIVAITVLASHPAHALPFPSAGSWDESYIGTVDVGGSVSGDVITADAVGAGSNLVEGYFRHRAAPVGTDVRIHLSSFAGASLSGVMVRDDISPTSAFAFLGKNSSGELLIVVRRENASPIRVTNFGVLAGTEWLRVIVGRSTAYFYRASTDYSYTSLHDTWTPLAAVDISLSDHPADATDDDRVGAVVESGSATFATLLETTVRFWSERTTPASSGDVVENGVGWSSVDSTGYESYSSILRRNDGPSGASASLPLAVTRAGRYDVYAHLPGQAGALQAPQSIEVVVGTTTSAITIESLGEQGAWIYCGAYTLGAATESSSGGNFVNFLSGDPSDPDNPATVFADAVRAIYRPDRAPSWDAAFWQANNRIKVTNNNDWSQVVERKDGVGATGWNAGAHTHERLFGDGIFRFRMHTDDKNVIVGFSRSPSGATEAGIDPRIFAQSDRDLVPSGIAFGGWHYNTTQWLEIERVGHRVRFRRDGALLGTRYFSTNDPVWLDCSISHFLGRFKNARVYGDFVTSLPSDNDGLSDALELSIVDFDLEDEIQSVFDVVGWEDFDGDGLSNADEFQLGTAATNVDHDGDDLWDGWEVANGFDPVGTNERDLHADSDGLTNYEEFSFRFLPEYGQSSNPRSNDTDSDGIDDNVEHATLGGLGFKPTSRDSDADGLFDESEWLLIHALPDDGIVDQLTALPEGDFDLDNVWNIDEQQDGTSLVDADDYFIPFEFGRFGRLLDLVGTLVVEGQSGSSLELVTDSAVSPGFGRAVSHHRLGTGSRVRFTFPPIAGGGFGAGSVGLFLHDPISPLAEADYSFRVVNSGDASAIFDYPGASAPLPTVLMGESDVFEFEVDLTEGNQKIRLERVDFEGGADALLFDIPVDPAFPIVDGEFSVRVDLDESNSIVRGRYRKIVDPDSDSDGMADAWEEQIAAADPAKSGFLDVSATGQDDSDSIDNLTEFLDWSNPVDGLDFRSYASFELPAASGLNVTDEIPGISQSVAKSDTSAGWSVVSESPLAMPRDGEVRFRFRDGGRSVIGLSENSSSSGPDEIPFRMEVVSEGLLDVIGPDQIVVSSGIDFNRTDEFVVERRGDAVSVFKNTRDAGPIASFPLPEYRWLRFGAAIHDFDAGFVALKSDGFRTFVDATDDFTDSRQFAAGNLGGQNGYATAGVVFVEEDVVGDLIGVELGSYGSELSKPIPTTGDSSEIELSVFLDANAEFEAGALLSEGNVDTLVSFDPALGVVVFNGNGAGGGAWENVPGTASLVGAEVVVRLQIDHQQGKWRVVVDDEFASNWMEFRNQAHQASELGLRGYGETEERIRSIRTRTTTD